MKTVRDADIAGKRVLLRVDFNVPIDEKGNVLDDSRIKASVPTINFILDNKPRQLIIMCHLGEPDGRIVSNLTLDEVSKSLTILIEKTVYKTKDCIVSRMPGEGLILLENLRFHKEEVQNDAEFAKKLASYADIYVNDAFGVCHRKHASVHAITKLLPCYIGLLVEKELENLDLDKMERPVHAILGGGKLKTKIPLIKRMLLKADKVMVGGAMIFTFYKAKRLDIGHSACDEDYVKDAEMMIHNEKLYIPVDVVVADATKSGTEIFTVDAEKIPSGSAGLDIGSKSVSDIKNILGEAKTIIWNGPLGYYEKPPFDKATLELAGFIAGLESKRIISGGDTAAAIHSLGLDERFDFISSGGGAAIELLSGGELVALQALEEAQKG